MHCGLVHVPDTLKEVPLLPLFLIISGFLHLLFLSITGQKKKENDLICICSVRLHQVLNGSKHLWL